MKGPGTLGPGSTGNTQKTTNTSLARVSIARERRAKTNELRTALGIDEFKAQHAKGRGGVP
jgi:hypothetical protein